MFGFFLKVEGFWARLECWIMLSSFMPLIDLGSSFVSFSFHLPPFSGGYCSFLNYCVRQKSERCRVGRWCLETCRERKAAGVLSSERGFAAVERLSRCQDIGS